MSNWGTNSRDAWSKAWSKDNLGGTIGAGVSGLTGIASTFGETARLKEGKINELDNQIDDINNTQFGYGDYDSLQSAFINPQISDFSSYDLRQSDGERAISTLKGTASGAMAGAQIGGPIGAIVGGAAGLLSGIGGSIFGNRKAKREAERLNQEAEDAKNRYLANFSNNAEQISQNKFNTAALNLAAFGGMLKNNNIDNFTKSKVRLAAFGGNMFSPLGREDGFTNGVVKVNEGGSHETNPYDGVLMGVDPAGTPNLVEEGEVLFNDYVFSNRLYPTGGQLESVRLPKRYEGKSYSEIAWDLQKESQLNPLDKISRNTLIDSMAKLTTLQEQSRERDQEYQAFDNLEQVFADGGDIHIKKSKVGTFTAAAKKHGMGVQEFASQVLANKDKYSTAMVRKANFAHNSTGWKHAFGGKIGNALTGDGDIQNDKTQIDNTRVSLVAPSFTPMWEAPSKKALFNSGLFLDDNGVYYYGPYLETRYVSNDFAKNRVEEDMRRFMRYREDDVLNGKQIYESKSRRGYPKSYTSKPVFAFGGPMGNMFAGTGDRENELYFFGQTSDANDNLTPKDGMPLPYGFEDVVAAVRGERAPGFSLGRPKSLTYNLPDSFNPAPVDWKNAFSNLSFNTDDIYNIPNEPVVLDEKLNLDTTANIPAKRVASPKSFRTNNLAQAFRAVPVVGSAINAIGDAVGWRNKEDYTWSDRIGQSARTIRNVKAPQIGGYMSYNPYDVDYEMNRLQNVGLGTQRALLDTAGGNSLAARNAMLTLNNNITSQMGEARRRGAEYNDNLRRTIQQFNTGIDQFNAGQSMNSQIYNQRADEERVNDIIRQAMLADSIQSATSQARSTEETAALNNAGQWGNDMMYNDMARYYLEHIAPNNDATKDASWILGRRYGAKGGKIKRSNIKEFKKK